MCSDGRPHLCPHLNNIVAQEAEPVCHLATGIAVLKVICQHMEMAYYSLAHIFLDVCKTTIIKLNPTLSHMLKLLKPI